MEVESRIAEIEKMILTGCSYREIREHIVNKYEVSTRSFEAYIAEARKEIRKLTVVDIENEKLKSLRRKEMILRNCLILQDYKNALAAQEDIDNLLGLNADKKQLVDVNMNVKRIILEDNNA